MSSGFQAEDGGGNAALFLGTSFDFLHIPAYAGEHGKVILNIGARRGPGDPEVGGQGKVGHPVNQAEIDSFGTGTHLRRHFFRWYALDRSGRHAVNIPTGGKRRFHARIIGNVRQDAQFNLRIIGVDKQPAVFGHKHPP